MEQHVQHLSDLPTYQKLQKIEIERTKLLTKTEGSLWENLPSDYKTQYLYLDFVYLFVRMGEVIFGNSDADDKRKGSNLDDKYSPRNAVGKFLKELAYATEKAALLKTAIRKLNRNAYDDKIWLANMYDHAFKRKHESDKLPEHILQAWIYFLNLSEQNVYARLVKDAFSIQEMRRIFSSLCFRALLMSELGPSFFRPFLLGEKLLGISGLPRYFDGYIRLRQNAGEIRPYLIKISTVGMTGTSIINNFCLAVEDVKPTLRSAPRTILFVPGYPTSDTLGTELYWRDTRRLNITVLYLVDFFEIFRLKDCDAILNFLGRRLDA